MNKVIYVAAGNILQCFFAVVLLKYEMKLAGTPDKHKLGA
tara:strand:+ start:273 stop:392 length:120 start_codon:yes stop_codon:yes gene_type:complete